MPASPVIVGDVVLLNVGPVVPRPDPISFCRISLGHAYFSVDAEAVVIDAMRPRTKNEPRLIDRVMDRAAWYFGGPVRTRVVTTRESGERPQRWLLVFAVESTALRFTAA